jgi:hypothetical protein
MPMLFSQNAEMLPCRTRQRRVLDRHANEYKSRSRRDDDGVSVPHAEEIDVMVDIARSGDSSAIGMLKNYRSAWQVVLMGEGIA